MSTEPRTGWIITTTIAHATESESFKATHEAHAAVMRSTSDGANVETRINPAAPQPVSRNAPQYNPVGGIERASKRDLEVITEPIDWEKVEKSCCEWDVPKVEEIARKLHLYHCQERRSGAICPCHAVADGMSEGCHCKEETADIAAILRPYFPPASQTPETAPACPDCQEPLIPMLCCSDQKTCCTLWHTDDPRITKVTAPLKPKPIPVSKTEINTFAEHLASGIDGFNNFPGKARIIDWIRDQADLWATPASTARTDGNRNQFVAKAAQVAMGERGFRLEENTGCAFDTYDDLAELVIQVGFESYDTGGVAGIKQLKGLIEQEIGFHSRTSHHNLNFKEGFIAGLNQVINHLIPALAAPGSVPPLELCEICGGVLPHDSNICRNIISQTAPVPQAEPPK